MSNSPSLPTDSAKRNRFPMFDGLLAYFPNALAAVAELSLVGNEQHNPGEPLHWSRDKSTDHANKIVKHLVDHGKFDSDNVRHSVKVAWRALALAQEEIEREEGAPVSRGSQYSYEGNMNRFVKYWANHHPMMAEVLRESDGKEHAP